MSPAKRLSRQRFRALCERCAVHLSGKRLPLRAIKRVARYEEHVCRANRRRMGNGFAFMAWFRAAQHLGTLARLAR